MLYVYTCIYTASLFPRKFFFLLQINGRFCHSHHHFIFKMGKGAHESFKLSFYASAKSYHLRSRLIGDKVTGLLLECLLKLLVANV